MRLLVRAHALGAQGWTLAAIAVLAYVIAVVRLSPLPLQDLPTHLARAVVMDDLLFHGGTHFGGVYHFHLLLIPYLLGDLFLTGAVHLFGPTAASALWGVFVLLSLPCAILLYLRLARLPIDRRPLLILLSLYLATDWFFAMGFVNFRIAIAMTLTTLGLVSALRRHWSRGLFAIYVCAVLLDYLMHLSAAVFLPAAVGVGALLRFRWRTTRLRTELLLAAPLAAVLLWNFTVADSYRLPSDLVEGPFVWGTLHSKFTELSTVFLRYQTPAEKVMLLGFVLCLILLAGRVRWQQLRRPQLLEPLALAATFFAIYFLLPHHYTDASYVDVRALPYVAIFIVLACAQVDDDRSSSIQTRMVVALTLAGALAFANLADLTEVLIRNNTFVTQYRNVAAAIPERARVLPVFTLRREGNVRPLLHVNSFVTIDRAGVIPYEFAGDNGNVVRYFRYLHLPDAPLEGWYLFPQVLRPDWNSIACDYDYLIVTQPFAAKRIEVSTQTVAQNEAAALLAIDRQTCASAMHEDFAASQPE